MNRGGINYWLQSFFGRALSAFPFMSPIRGSVIVLASLPTACAVGY